MNKLKKQYDDPRKSSWYTGRWVVGAVMVAILSSLAFTVAPRPSTIAPKGGSKYVLPAAAFHRADLFSGNPFGWITGLNEEWSGDACYIADVPITEKKFDVSGVTMHFYDNSSSADLSFLLFKRQPDIAGPPLTMAFGQTSGSSTSYPRTITDSTIVGNPVRQDDAFWMAFCFLDFDIPADLDNIRLIAFEISY